MYKLEQAINEMKAVLDMWEFMAKRTPFNEEIGANAWNEELAKRTYGTYTDQDGDEQICLSAAEESVAKLIAAAEELVKEYEDNLQKWNWERKDMWRKIDDIREFARMSDDKLGQYMEAHIDREKEREGQEELAWTPEWFQYVAARLRS